jgi:hypothetical protein
MLYSCGTFLTFSLAHEQSSWNVWLPPLATLATAIVGGTALVFANAAQRAWLREKDHIHDLGRAYQEWFSSIHCVLAEATIMKINVALDEGKSPRMALDMATGKLQLSIMTMNSCLSRIRIIEYNDNLAREIENIQQKINDYVLMPPDNREKALSDIKIHIALFEKVARMVLKAEYARLSSFWGHVWPWDKHHALMSNVSPIDTKEVKT